MIIGTLVRLAYIQRYSLFSTMDLLSFLQCLCQFGVRQFSSIHCGNTDEIKILIFSVFFVSAALFREFWKKYSSEITHRWDTTDYTPEEEHPRPQYMEQLKYVDETALNFVTNTKEPKVPYWSRRVYS